MNSKKHVFIHDNEFYEDVLPRTSYESSAYYAQREPPLWPVSFCIHSIVLGGGGGYWYYCTSIYGEVTYGYVYED